MKLAELFPKKSARKKPPGGLTQAQADAIEKEFLDAFLPLEPKATQYFRHFTVNGKTRWFLLPSVETIRDMSVERMQWILKYTGYFQKEVAAVEIDDIPYEFPTNTIDAPVQHSGE